MTEKKLEYFQKKLENLREEILKNIVEETAEEENPFQVDGDLADKAEALTNLAISEGLSSTQRETLEKVQMALMRIKNHEYGKCVVNGCEIEEERLEAMPYANTCKKHMNHH